MKVIELNASVTDSNDRDADQLRQDKIIFSRYRFSK